MSITKLFLSVSVIAMFAVGSAWASAPTGTDTVGTLHYVYTEEDLSKTDGYVNSGIAGVTYVNRMVGVAGGAAQQAENHAAAAGAYAIDAKTAAEEAKGALDGKVDYDNGETNMFMVTDNEGYVTAGSVGPGLQVANNEAMVKIDTASALGFDGDALTVVEASATVPGVMKWGQIPSGSAESTESATIWIE